MDEFYLVGSFCDPAWSQLEGGGRIAFNKDEENENYYVATASLNVGDTFKIITPAEEEGEWIWIGAQSEGNFLVLPQYYAVQPLTLIIGPDGENFEITEAGSYKITLMEAPVEPSGIAPKALQAPLVMIIDKITGIDAIDADKARSNEWYNLNGQKLNGKPSTPGIYINGGKKVIVR
jgi:hypothetical protein